MEDTAHAAVSWIRASIVAAIGSLSLSLIVFAPSALAGPQGTDPVQSIPTHKGASATAKSRDWPLAMGYNVLMGDPHAPKVWMCGGQITPEDLTDTGLWTFRTGLNRWDWLADSSPVPGWGDSCVYDEKAARIIRYLSFRPWQPGDPASAFGVKYVSETWAFDPVSGVWENRNPTQSPPPGLCNCGSQLAYNSAAGKVVMFGGWNMAGRDAWELAGRPQPKPNFFPSSTWVYDYDQNTWTEMSPAVSPPGRNTHGLVYDAAADRVILFGGSSAIEAFVDTWAYDYNQDTWTERHPALSPQNRGYSPMAYSSAHHLVVLFGGIDWDYNALGDTWVYDYWADAWTQRNPARSPSPRGWFGMTYSKHANEVILFGGGPDPYANTDEAWIYRIVPDKWEQVAKPR